MGKERQRKGEEEKGEEKRKKESREEKNMYTLFPPSPIYYPW